MQQGGSHLNSGLDRGLESSVALLLCRWVGRGERRRYRQFALLKVELTKWLQFDGARLSICTQKLCTIILPGPESTSGLITTPRHNNSQSLAQVRTGELLVWDPDREKLIEVTRCDYAMCQE